MKKKLLITIALTCALFMPMLVNAEEKCVEKTNYYFFHDAIEQYDDEVKAACPDGLDDCNAKFTETKRKYARFYNTIPSKASILSEGEIKLIDNNSEITISKYHDIWVKMLADGNLANFMTTMKDPNNSNISYFLHRGYGDSLDSTVASVPMFLDNIDINKWYNNSIQAKLRTSYLPQASNSFILNSMSVINRTSNFGTEKGNNNFNLEINRSYSMSGKDLKSCMNLTNFRTDTSGDDHYICIVPSVYKVVYNDCKEQYTITYHSNDDKNKSESDTVSEGETYKIKDNMFSRDGYNFVGWSTRDDATQADPTFNAGSDYTAEKNLDLYAVWVSAAGGKGTTDNSKTGLGYSLGIIGAILAATAGGVVYFKKRNKFENI